MLILNTVQSYEVGEILVSATDQELDWQGQRYKVIRESNFMEWLECFLRLGGNPKLVAPGSKYDNNYFYEVV